MEVRYEERVENPSYRHRRPNTSYRLLRKRRPGRPELKFHWDSRNNAESKIDPENPRPKSRRAVVMLVAGAQRLGLQVDDQERQPHRQLWKDVVKGYREGELQSVYVHCLSHQRGLVEILCDVQSCGCRFLAAYEECKCSAAFSHF